MDFLKAQWRPIVFGLVCLLSLGAGGWAYWAGSSIDEQLQSVERLRSTVEQARRNPANQRTVEQRQKEVQAANDEFERSLNAALAMQKYNAYYETVDADGKRNKVERKPLTDKVLTTQPASQADAIEFKTAYEEAIAKLPEKLKGRPGPTPDEISNYAARLQALQQGGGASVNPWGPHAAPVVADPDAAKRERPLIEMLRDFPNARVAEEIARSVYMYVDRDAFGKHPMTLSENAPGDVDIWQAQMALWIQQDMAVALFRCNEERAAEYVREKQDDRLWVAYMPVKRLIRLSIDNRLGKGGGSNLTSEGFPTSFTDIQNDDKMFVVPMTLEMVVEEAALMNVIDKICSVGFYTPIAINYRAVKPNPLQEEYIYGDQPVVQIRLDLEAYYVRKIFEKWIPKPLKDILKRPGARDDLNDR